MLHWIYSVVLQRIVCPTDFWISLVFLYKIDQNLNKWIIAEIMKKTTVKHVTVSKTSNSLLLYIVDKIDNDFFFFFVRPTDSFYKIDVLSIWDYGSVDYEQIWKDGN